MSAREWRAETLRLARRISIAFERIEGRLGAPASDLSRAPGPGEWSAIEVAEHVALTNHHLLLLAQKIAARCRTRSEAGDRSPEATSRLEFLERIAERGFRWESPEHMVPGGALTAREMAGSLGRQRRQCLRLLAGMREGEGALHSISMSVVGERLDLYQYLTVIALHLERHADQMNRALAAIRDPGRL